MADLYGSLDANQANAHRSAASALHSAILDLLWDADKVK